MLLCQLRCQKCSFCVRGPSVRQCKFYFGIPRARAEDDNASADQGEEEGPECAGEPDAEEAKEKQEDTGSELVTTDLADNSDKTPENDEHEDDEEEEEETEERESPGVLELSVDVNRDQGLRVSPVSDSEEGPTTLEDSASPSPPSSEGLLENPQLAPHYVMHDQLSAITEEASNYGDELLAELDRDSLLEEDETELGNIATSP